MKSFLFVMQIAAYDGAKVQEVLDQVLITAAFDQQVSLLLLDDAVYHLHKNQCSDKLANKDISAIYRSLQIYDIEHIYVEQESLSICGLTQDAMLIPVSLLKRQDVATIFKSFDFILSA
ncbi:sulfurtransferase complex subunit TusC [Bathymodiolus platifrons methanotrophic gill symbiont]|uniref:sulfurtransferase complex subunit TusC n=1 Tax=Bathymodiolus platifrons methanotrophic gill symbiont TaxID=113268 RepID=UPI001124EDF0|nr:sulfurtransferase complex subunit TusC [Bathymodiolus platifrons methanotrophic gill symbiont]